ncbi:NUDIX domain-containing protein [Pendulispora rubella]|uniref:NUDIX domain-containing protein n=1 Tax=Pendulispora rubella TaxID=2741070 RepID=A0ABZ2LFR4_9BACT
MVSHAHVLEIVDLYAERFPERAAALAPLRALLAESADVTSRLEFRGHVTCGAVVRDAEGRVLLVHHRALDRWLMPGGHLEAGDRTLLGAAARELVEEVGFPPDALRVPFVWHEVPVHIDCHGIPANPKKGEPSHEHWDFRYVFEVSDAAAITLQAEEVLDAAWRSPAEHSQQLVDILSAAAAFNPALPR